MSGESATFTEGSSDEPASPVNNDGKSEGYPGGAGKLSASQDLLKEQEDLVPDHDPCDTTLEHWTFDQHLQAMVKDMQQHNLPPMSFRSSVIWKDLLVRVAGAGIMYQDTVGEIMRGPVTAVQHITLHGKPSERIILHSVEGVLREGEMLLVLGRPGSGCSTLLKTLCGLTDEYLGWQGDVRYNGVDVETFTNRFRGDAVYTSDGESDQLFKGFIY
jgi:ABC-type multidrug transport system fused ATPase/permease subunit